MGYPVDRDSATLAARMVARSVGIDPGDIDALGRLPASAILSSFQRGNRMVVPVVDGHTLPRQPLVAISDGVSADIPLLIGTDRDEMRVLSGGHSLPRTEKELAQLLVGQGRELVKHYLATRHHLEFPELCERVMTDAWFRIPSIRFAARKAAVNPSVYMYLFEWENQDRPDVGAAHGQETPFVFNNLDAVLVTRSAADGHELADQMSASWAAFARAGDPSTSALQWPRHNTGSRATMILGRQPHVAEDPGAEDRMAWDEFAPEGTGPLVHPDRDRVLRES